MKRVAQLLAKVWSHDRVKTARDPFAAEVRRAFGSR